MKFPACPPKPLEAPSKAEGAKWGRGWIRTLLNIPLGLLFLHLASLPTFALCGPCVPCVDCGGYCGIETPIGCIPTDLEAAKPYLFCIMLDLVALLAVIMFVIGGYQVMTAGDNPETLQEGKGKMTTAITGLIAFLLFAWIIHIILGIEMLAFPIVCNIP